MNNNVLKVVILQAFLLVNCLNHANSVWLKNEAEYVKIGQTDTVANIVYDSISPNKSDDKEVIENKRQSKTIENDLNTFLRIMTADDDEYLSVLNSEVNYDYSGNGYSKSSKTNNFLSAKSKKYVNINGNDVTADLFYIGNVEQLNHPNLGQAILLYQAIKYKIYNPDDYNEINLTTFRLSVIAGFCIVPSSPYYGTMKSMPDTRVDRDGFVRISHLITVAAKIGIKVNVIAQQPGYSNYGLEIHPNVYFNSIMDEPCFSKVGLSSKKVKDFLNYRTCEWLSYEGKAAADMYHLKTCTVLHYLDNENVVRNYGVYFSSSNVDGVHLSGVAGLTSSQSGIILTNHRYIYLCTRNFVRFSIDYCGYDMASDFRNQYIKTIKKQKIQISEHGYDYLSEELMIYLGSDDDPVFELYITPLDGSEGMWSEDNPFCKYVSKMQRSREHIGFKWNNPKSSMTYEFISTFFKIVKKSFKRDRGQNENLQNELSLKMVGFDETYFDDLIVGQHLGKKTIANYSGVCHEKDCVFLFEEGGIRNSVALINSLNEHQGAFWYQVNQLLVVKENIYTGTDLVDTLYEKM